MRDLKVLVNLFLLPFFTCDSVVKIMKRVIATVIFLKQKVEKFVHHLQIDFIFFDEIH